MPQSFRHSPPFCHWLWFRTRRFQLQPQLTIWRRGFSGSKQSNQGKLQFCPLKRKNWATKNVLVVRHNENRFFSVTFLSLLGLASDVNYRLCVERWRPSNSLPLKCHPSIWWQKMQSVLQLSGQSCLLLLLTRFQPSCLGSSFCAFSLRKKEKKKSKIIIALFHFNDIDTSLENSYTAIIIWNDLWCFLEAPAWTLAFPLLSWH